MKRIITITLIASVNLIWAQQTVTSVISGAAANPFTWDCTCIPQFSDNIIINHDITLDTDWIINNGGSVTVGINGSLIRDAQNRTILLDGGGAEFINQGTTELTYMAFVKNSTGINTNNLIINNALYLDTLATFNNQGALNDIDSTLSMGTFSNSGTFLRGSFWTGGNFTNTGYIEKDSLLNTGLLTSSLGAIIAYDFANTGDFYLTGTSFMEVTNNFYNTGEVNIASGRDLRVSNDFLSGDSTFSTANITNNGLIEVANDFLNLDTLQGSGLICIGGTSSNTGRVIGTLDICSNSTTDLFNFNIGQVDASVTNCQSGCLVENDSEIIIEHIISVFPNPAIDKVFIESSIDGINSIELYNTFGQLVVKKTTGDLTFLDISNIKSGTYSLKLFNQEKVSQHKIIKQF